MVSADAKCALECAPCFNTKYDRVHQKPAKTLATCTCTGTSKCLALSSKEYKLYISRVWPISSSAVLIMFLELVPVCRSDVRATELPVDKSYETLAGICSPKHFVAVCINTSNGLRWASCEYSVSFFQRVLSTRFSRSHCNNHVQRHASYIPYLIVVQHAHRLLCCRSKNEIEGSGTIDKRRTGILWFWKEDHVNGRFY